MVSRKYLPKDTPKVCTICKTTTSSTWRVKRTAEANMRICNKCACKSLYYKPSVRTMQSCALKSAIHNLLTSEGEMKTRDIVNRLNDMACVRDHIPAKLCAAKVRAYMSYHPEFIRVSRGVYALRNV